MAALRIACLGTEERYKDKLEKQEVSIKQKENETLDDYGQRFVALYSEMEGLGIQPSEKKAIDHVLNGITAEGYEGFKRQIGTIRELKSLSLGEFISKMTDEERKDTHQEKETGQTQAMRAVAVSNQAACHKCGEVGHCQLDQHMFRAKRKVHILQQVGTPREGLQS